MDTEKLTESLLNHAKREYNGYDVIPFLGYLQPLGIHTGFMEGKPHWDECIFIISHPFYMLRRNRFFDKIGEIMDAA